MKKRESIHTFVLLLILIVAVGVIFLQSNLKFTGYVVGPNGEQCDGNWTNSGWGECIDGNQTKTWTSTDSTNCISPILEYQSCTVENITCTENWSCVDWEICVDGNQTRTCTDSNSCGTTETKPAELQSCTVENITCTENWACGNWTGCSSETQTRTCTDSNSCGTTETKPAESQYCTQSSSTESSEDDVSVEVPSTTMVTSQSSNSEQSSSCTPDWQCGDWQECVDGIQIRICTDSNQCNPEELASTESQVCVVEIKENCSDGIKNQNEAGIDCGGSCEKKCSFLTIVGNAITGPIDAGKKFILEGMFGNMTKTMISVGILVFIIGGVIIFILFKKGIISMKFSLKNLKQ